MKVCIITCSLIPEANAEKDDDLEREIREELKTRQIIPWCKNIEKVEIQLVKE